MRFDWPHKKSNPLDAHKNEAQDKRNWGTKDAAKGCLKLEESIKPNNKKGSFNASRVRIITSLN
jgi:hypothetical protein